uniref:Translation initiation factor IF2/IF5 domain-containing protein n=1 Tax=Panagrolaimus sp. JU765 TaxID=591449 RepID=A0AC34QKL6_9BILA
MADDEANLNIEEELKLDLKKKKKKPAKEKAGAKSDAQAAAEKVVVDPAIQAEAAAFELGKLNLIDSKRDWPDYTYEELLAMVFGIMREKNPELSGDKKKFVMKPPQVARAGSKKTAFTNYAEICKLLRRQPKHVLQFLLAELGTTGSIDSNQCLIVKGRFQQKHFENVLRKYIKEYVTCHTCRSSDTDLTRDTRLFFLQCKTCGSRCSVTTIKSGFTAMVGKRAAIRRAAEATAGR